MYGDDDGGDVVDVLWPFFYSLKEGLDAGETHSYSEKEVVAYHPVMREEMREDHLVDQVV